MSARRNGKGPALALFEHAQRRHIPFLLWYLWRGSGVRYLRADPGVPRSLLLGRYRAAGRIGPVDPGPYDFEGQRALNQRVAIASKDTLRREIGHTTLPGRMRELLRSPLADLVYRKGIALEMVAHARNRFILSGLARAAGAAGPVLMVPAPSRILEADPSGGDPSREAGIVVPGWARAMNRFTTLVWKLKWLAVSLLFPFWILARIGIPSREQKAPREEFQLGIRVYGNDIGFGGKIRNIDFILDGQLLHRGNTMFCLETGVSRAYLAALERRNYRYVEVRKILRNADIPFIRRTVLGEFLPAWGALIRHGLSLSPLVLRTSLEVFDRYLTWSRFFSRYGMKKYISYNDFREGSTVRNLVFRIHGTESHYYVHSSHFFNLFLPGGGDEFQTVEFLFLVFDTFVGWGEKVARAFASPWNHIGRFRNTGCLWSEHIAGLVRAGRVPAIREEVFRRVRERSGKECSGIIGVYDTSFGAGLPLEASDVILFIEGVLGLLDRYPDIVLVFKNKNPLGDIFANHPETQQYYDRLRTDPRCFISGDIDISSEELIAASDLCIDACFTAPAAEALGARRKTLFFDAGGTFRGSYFDRFPFLVAHDPGELDRFVNYWMHEISGDDFDRFLDTRIRGEVDAFVDGKGITRFRQILCGTDLGPLP